jgi:Fic family protein
MKYPERPPSSDLKFEEEGDLFIKAISNNELSRKLIEIDKNYPFWEDFKYKIKEESNAEFTKEFLWKVIKSGRKRTEQRLIISDLQSFHFSFNLTNETLQKLHEFDLHLGGSLEGKNIIPTEDKNRYLISSIMEEAIASSQLEGAVTTREVAKEMLRTQRKPRDHSEKMILNNYLTIQRILELKDVELTPEILLDIHKIVSRDTLEDPNNEGRFRTSNNVHVTDNITGDIFYTPPDFHTVEKLVSQFCNFANDENDEKHFIHPIIRGIVLHFLIGYIHPFIDGNGRTARAIFYWYLLSRGYWLIEFMSISRIIVKSPSQYARAYLHTEYDENDLTYFINYQVKSMDLAFKSLRDYISRKINEKRNAFNLIKAKDLNERQALILQDIIHDPHRSISIKNYQGRFNVVYQTARMDLLDLVKKGYLTSKTAGKKMLFYASDNFEQIKKQVLK